MREDAFRAYLASVLGGPAVVASYLSNARLIERTLSVDLDQLDIGQDSIGAIRERLIRAGIAGPKASDCCSALRRYAQVRSNDRDTLGPVGRPISRPTVGISPSSHRHPAVSGAKTPDLMRLYGDILTELRERGVSRTANGPVGDYAEYLFAKAFGWKLAANSEAGYDATDDAGRRYQVKGRRLGRRNASRQLGVLRRLPERSFDALAAVLFDETMRVHRAILVPHALVMELATKVEHVNGWRLMLSDRIWTLPGVVDATLSVRAVA